MSTTLISLYSSLQPTPMVGTVLLNILKAMKHCKLKLLTLDQFFLKYSCIL